MPYSVSNNSKLCIFGYNNSDSSSLGSVSNTIAEQLTVIFRLYRLYVCQRASGARFFAVNLANGECDENSEEFSFKTGLAPAPALPRSLSLVQHAVWHPTCFTILSPFGQSIVIIGLNGNGGC